MKSSVMCLSVFWSVDWICCWQNAYVHSSLSLSTSLFLLSGMGGGMNKGMSKGPGMGGGWDCWLVLDWRFPLCLASQLKGDVLSPWVKSWKLWRAGLFALLLMCWLDLMLTWYLTLSSSSSFLIRMGGGMNKGGGMGMKGGGWVVICGQPACFSCDAY